jgi:hypothetical protein
VQQQLNVLPALEANDARQRRLELQHLPGEEEAETRQAILQVQR